MSWSHVRQSILCTAICVACAGGAAPLAAAQAADAPSPVMELGNFLPVGWAHLGAFSAKVHRKQPVVVAFLGGALTRGKGTSPGTGYRDRLQNSLSLLVNQQGGSVTYITAASDESGPQAGSASGAQRIGREVLTRKPDLLVIEYAADDSNLAMTGINGFGTVCGAMESIVRQARSTNPGMGIILFQTVQPAQLSTYYEKHLLPPSVVSHHLVAQHYGVHEVLAGCDIEARIASSYVTPQQFSPNGVVTSEYGHELYHQLLAGHIASILELPDVSPAPLPAPLGKMTFTSAQTAIPIPGDSGWNAAANGALTSSSQEKAIPLPLPKGSGLTVVFRGSMAVSWTTPAGTERKAIHGARGTTAPTMWQFPATGTDPRIAPLLDRDGNPSELLGVISFH